MLPPLTHRPLPVTQSQGPQRGFTFVELLIVTLILAVLAAIAMPSYQRYAQRGRRADAINALNAVMLAQERYRSGQSSYASSLSVLFGGSVNLAEHYDITISGVTSSTFVLAAAPKSGDAQQADSNCAQMLISMAAGQLSYSSKNSGGTASQGCWSK